MKTSQPKPRRAARGARPKTAPAKVLVRVETNGTADKEKWLTRTISLPTSLAEKADAKVAAMPEMNFSRYTRNLMRRDLEKEERSRK